MQTLTLSVLLVGALFFCCVCCTVLRMEILACQSAIRLVIVPLLTQAIYCFGEKQTVTQTTTPPSTVESHDTHSRKDT